ncbi:conserved hypothetical protein [Anaeromyxobacter sp. K]|uniref:neutral/alkaline non-lysosomal ceramidase N-terminal domain-containing protein n=1 Tax=Anaeromyxobacter sp. (strain K) TaxID=447217 RepID=UPI00015F9466|nr:neutral/alkaline non-lysosomal ceramidase N-terminal domain-containing protein [Anaeromyxobacter sp. K]ACG75542.1 conserved hypothetical protein [Anaeromyxobacter sp. K]
MPPARRLLLAAAFLLGIPAAILAIASLPWHGDRPAEAARVTAARRCQGPLSAGAAATTFDLPPGVPIGGFARLRYRSEGVRDPVGARALVLSVGDCRYALASAEILLVPESLEVAVRARLGDVPLDGLLVGATHTHSGPGGYWDHVFGEHIATGPFDPALRDRIAGGIAQAIRAAAAASGPARLSVGEGRAEELAYNRTEGPVEARLTVVRIDRPDGVPVSELAIFASHPTTLGRANLLISGDWPGRYLAATGHGVRLFFQGALGDQAATPVNGPEGTPTDRYGDAFSRAVDGLAYSAPDPAPAVGFATADVPLPAPDPGAVPPLLRRAASNASWDTMPARAEVEALRLGGLVLVAVPGEPVSEIAEGWRRAAGPGARIVSLVNGYVGYVETPRMIAADRGETPRTYYGPSLAARLEPAVAAAAAAVRAEPPAHPPDGAAGRGRTPAAAGRR